MRHTIRSFFRLSWYRGFKIKNHILKSSRHFYPTCSQTTFKVQQLSFILTKSCRLTYLQYFLHYRIFSLPNPISDHSFHHHQNFLQNKNLIFTISKLIFEIYTFKNRPGARKLFISTNTTFVLFSFWSPLLPFSVSLFLRVLL